MCVIGADENLACHRSICVWSGRQQCGGGVPLFRWGRERGPGSFRVSWQCSLKRSKRNLLQSCPCQGHGSTGSWHTQEFQASDDCRCYADMAWWYLKFWHVKETLSNWSMQMSTVEETGQFKGMIWLSSLSNWYDCLHQVTISSGSDWSVYYSIKLALWGRHMLSCWVWKPTGYACAILPPFGGLILCWHINCRLLYEQECVKWKHH